MFHFEDVKPLIRRIESFRDVLDEIAHKRKQTYFRDKAIDDSSAQNLIQSGNAVDECTWSNL